MTERPQTSWRSIDGFTKSAIDALGAVLGLLVSLPVLVATASAIKIVMGSPVLFRQQRAGRGGALFELVKFRTMHSGSGTDEQRLTRLGRILRATSLDELPELWNVLRGEMSLVGPRPLLPQYLGRYTAEQDRRHDVKPGITGWAQIHGRNQLGWEKRLALDVWYVDHRSILLDLRILIRTVRVVISGRGIGAPGRATMAEFRGTGPHAAGDEA